VDIKMGPDGAVYIADWYNPIINHGEVDFRDPRRDHSHGRIWRVTAKGRPLVDRPVIAGAPVGDILRLLKSPENYTRLQAKQELRARGASAVLPALADWVKSLRAKDADHEHDLLEALWVYQTLDTVEPELLSRLLRADDPSARAPAVRVASRWASQLPNITQLLSDAVADENPRVRLEAVRALALVPSPQSITIAARVLDKPMDPFLDYALWLTANDLKDLWLPAFQAGKLTTWAKPSHLSFALQAVKSPAALSSLVSQLKSNQLAPESRGDVIDLIATIDPSGQAGTLFDLALGGDVHDSATKLRLLSALERIARQDHVRPANDPARIKPLLDDSDPQMRAAALRLAGLWHLQEFRPELTQLAESPETPSAIRAAAFDGLAALGGPPSAKLFQKLSEPANKPDVRGLAIASLVSLDASDAARRAADFLGDGAGGIDPAALLAAFVEREGGSDVLAKALADKKLPTDTARLALRYLQSLASTDSSLSDLVRKSIGLSSGPTRLTAEQMKQTVAEVMQNGDAARGEQIFRSKQTGCFQCHAIGGAGGWLAPDLRAIGASSPLDYLVDSVLDPNKAVKDGYAGYTVVTKSGDAFSGIKVRQDAHTLVLRDNAHEEIPIPLTSIKLQKEVGSLMPTGLADTLTRGEFLDLIRFLSELGKPGPYGPSTAQLVRRWRVLQNPPESELSADPKQLPPLIAADSPAWVPEYSLVSGTLPVGDLGGQPGHVALARCQLDVSSPGKIKLIFNSVAGLEAWIDGKPVELANESELNLDHGIRTLTFRIDLSARGKDGLRLEVADIAGSGGHAQPLGGK
jgi:putative heme-binding domain-containing protein